MYRHVTFPALLPPKLNMLLLVLTGTKELFEHIATAKRSELPVVIIAVGGGVNGNCIGLIAACTNVHLVEVGHSSVHFTLSC